MELRSVLQPDTGHKSFPMEIRYKSFGISDVTVFVHNEDNTAIPMYNTNVQCTIPYQYQCIAVGYNML